MVIRENFLNMIHVRKHYFVVRRRITSYLSKKSPFEGFFSYLVPRHNSSRNNQDSLDQLSIISKVSKAFYREVHGDFCNITCGF